MGEDTSVGKTTCHDISVIYYLMSSSDNFALLTEFQVMDLVYPLFYDLHCRLKFGLNILAQEIEIYDPQSADTVAVKWIDDKKMQCIVSVQNK